MGRFQNMTRPNEEQYKKAIKDIGLYFDWINAAQKKVDRLLNQIEKERNCIKVYNNYLEAAKEIVDLYEEANTYD